MMPKRVAVWLRILSIPVLVTLFTPAIVLAEGLRILTDLAYQTSNSDTTDRQTGQTISSDFSRFSQLYDLDLQKKLYPYLNLHAGGLFDLQTVRTSREGSHAKAKQRTAQYFAGLQLNNPLHKAGLTYRNSALKTSATDFTTQTIFREQYIAHWSWRPADLPSFNLDYNRSHALDKPKTRDSIFELLTFRTRYEYSGVSFDYTHSRSDNREEFSDTGSLSQIHNGGIRYSTRLLGDRVSLAAGTRVNYSTLEPSGGGDIRRPTSALGSEFYLLDDPYPFESEIDDFTAVNADNPLTAVNIGSGSSSDRQPSVGLDFGSPIEVDTLYILPLESDDPALDLASTAEIDRRQGLFSWEVFISNDQETWQSLGSFDAYYSDFDNRFEIPFDREGGVSTRYVKVRITPPSEPNPIVGQILISQVQGFTTIDASAGDTLEDLDQNYNIGLRWAITDRTTTAYDAYYKVLTAKPSGRRRSTLTNSVSLRHVFSPMFFGNVRVLRSEVHATGRDDNVHHSYVASIRGNYLETFSQSLIYSGTHTKNEEGSSTADSIFLRSSADLYEDWSANLDLGQSWKNPSQGAKTRSSLIRARTNLIPNERIHLRLDYSFAWITERGEDSRIEQSGRAELLLVPLKTLSLFAAVSFKDRDQGNRGGAVTQNYSVNWAPFPDGSLNFSVGYNYLKGAEGVDERFISPELRWQIARGVLLTLRYTTGTVESATTKSDRQVFNANLRVYY